MSPLAVTFVCIGAILLALFIAYFCQMKKQKRNTRRNHDEYR